MYAVRRGGSVRRRTLGKKLEERCMGVDGWMGGVWRWEGGGLGQEKGVAKVGEQKGQEAGTESLVGRRSVDWWCARIKRAWFVPGEEFVMSSSQIQWHSEPCKQTSSTIFWVACEKASHVLPKKKTLASAYWHLHTWTIHL